MEKMKNNDKSNIEKKQKVSVGRSLTMKLSNFRSRHSKPVDKCGRLTNRDMDIGRPLTTSLSMGAMDRVAHWRGDPITPTVPRPLNLCHACSSRASARTCGCSATSDANSNGLVTTTITLNKHCSAGRCNSRKCKGKSLDALTCYQCELERSNCVSMPYNQGNMQVSGSSGITQSTSLHALRSPDTFSHRQLVGCETFRSITPVGSVALSSRPSSGLMCIAASGSCISPHPAPTAPPPPTPGLTHSPDAAAGAVLSNCSWDKIYASRQEWLTMAKSHRSSLKEKLQEEFLSCKICLEPYQSPKALPCLHTFCEHCLQDYVRRHTGQRPGYFACPMCRKDTRIPDGGVGDLQDNFLLMSLSDTLDEDGVSEALQDPYHVLMSPPRSLAPPTPLEQKLKQHEWYFGKVSRNASEEWLLSSGYPKGSFLIRQGEASPDTLTLSVRDCDELRGYLVKHYKIFIQNSNSPRERYYITAKRMFSSIQELVDHYLESADGLCCRLSQICGKPRSLSWAQNRGKEDAYSTPKDIVTILRRLGSGQFAEVYLGKWHQQSVAVKIQRPDTVKMAAFLDEAQILKTLDHPNILQLLAVCNKKEPVFLVTEYLAHGRLSLYLREGEGSELKLSQLVWICAQVADALSYMEKEKFIHRNLGARNILVGEGNKVKVAGFGMTKCADDPDFNFRRGLKMAIKWMAPEVLKYNKYSTKADVWSFGILMMEVMMHGKEPYEGMGSKEAFENVEQGYRMPCPDMCPSEIYDVILSCWSTNPPSRPSFDFLNTFLHDRQSPT